MKRIYIPIKNRLKAEISQLRWIDMDTDQMNSASRPAIALPAALINIDIGDCQSLADEIQLCRGTVSVTLVFDNPGPTSANTPEHVIDLSLTPYDIIGDVHKALQGFDTEEFEALSRIKQGKVRNRHGLFQYEITYRTVFED
ncbi:hypothetical protein [Alkaliflexus imshenetskii]|uniref:hypothetical protein n=1 Tax=Alkaliflexus imshenetskii TaxID=286730 RepID=UPI0012FA3801|nr:hypothetical protein [Alkaliflexus imshenetskii]